jgi:thiol-disulfide isomerase/thioredoxin
VVRGAAIAGLLLVGAAAVTSARSAARQWQQSRPLLPGDRLPRFQLVDLAGAVLDSTSLANRVVVIDFWASWCPQCVAAMPHLRQIRHDFEARGVALVSVNVDSGDRQALPVFVAEHQLDFSVYGPADALQAAFGVDALPTVAIADRNGVIRHVYLGATSEKTLRSAILELL